mgnify:CR=1 FL=1
MAQIRIVGVSRNISKIIYVHHPVMVQICVILNAKLPESNSGCGGYIERIDTVCHRNADYIVRLIDCFVLKTIPSVPITMANLGSVAKIGLSIEIDFSVSAIATVRKPCLRNSLGELSNQVHGIRKTEPIEP